VNHACLLNFWGSAAVEHSIGNTLVLLVWSYLWLVYVNILRYNLRLNWSLWMLFNYIHWPIQIQVRKWLTLNLFLNNQSDFVCNFLFQNEVLVIVILLHLSSDSVKSITSAKVCFEWFLLHLLHHLDLTL
jgi:hypothetical protein